MAETQTRAKVGGAAGPRGASAGSRGASAAGAKARGPRAAPPPPEAAAGRAHAAPSCSVSFCPICLVVAAVGEARPELVAHLLIAGREVLLAVRAAIDARLESLETVDGERPTRLERITIE